MTDNWWKATADESRTWEKASQALAHRALEVGHYRLDHDGITGAIAQFDENLKDLVIGLSFPILHRRLKNRPLPSVATIFTQKKSGSARQPSRLATISTRAKARSGAMRKHRLRERREIP